MQSDVAQLTRERDEALQQQTATADVLKVISRSPGDLEAVFQTLLENATRICEAKFGVLMRFDGEAFRCAAHLGTPPALVELMQCGPIRPPPGSHLDNVMRTKQVSHTADYAADGVPAPPVTLGGARSTVDVPMLKDDELIGAFSIYRQEVRPFTEKQIALVRTSPTRPSSPSRTRACSMSCANRCSSRPRPPTCSRSSAARPSICRPSSTR